MGIQEMQQLWQHDGWVILDFTGTRHVIYVL